MIQITLKAGHHQPNSFVIFQGIWTSIAKEPYSFVIFQGVRIPCLSSAGISACINQLSPEIMVPTVTCVLLPSASIGVN